MGELYIQKYSNSMSILWYIMNFGKDNIKIHNNLYQINWEYFYSLLNGKKKLYIDIYHILIRHCMYAG